MCVYLCIARNEQRLSLERANEVTVKNKLAIDLYSELHTNESSIKSQSTLEPLLGMHATKVNTYIRVHVHVGYSTQANTQTGTTTSIGTCT